MKKVIILALTIGIFVSLYFSNSFPPGKLSISGSTIPDSDGDLLTSLRISEGKGLYSDFSILYPPGRFFLQGLLFALLSPSYAWIYMSKVLTVSVFFPSLLFLLTFLIFQKLQTRFLWSYLLSLLSAVLYLSFIRTAQEIHLLLALFFIIMYSSASQNSLKTFLLGLVMGLVFLFRIDSGIVLLLSLAFSVHPKTYKKPVLFAFGFAAVWLPTLIAISVNGSLVNFFYDTIILGLIVQPSFMGLPIPQNELWKVWLATLVFLSSSMMTLTKEQKTLGSFGLFAVLSYVSALGRADEAHLWYGLIWLPICILFTTWRIGQELSLRRIPNLAMVLVFGCALIGYAWLILTVKSPSFFLIITCILFLGAQKIQISAQTLLFGGCLSALLIFHSVSYLKLLFIPPGLPAFKTFPREIFYQSTNEVMSFTLLNSSQEMVDQLRADIPPSQTHLFIFPKNLLLHAFLQKESPTRYIILMNERTDKTERDIISDLTKTHTQYVLTFPKSAAERGGMVWDWIQSETTVLKTYTFSEETAQLRVLNSVVSCTQ